MIKRGPFRLDSTTITHRAVIAWKRRGSAEVKGQKHILYTPEHWYPDHLRDITLCSYDRVYAIFGDSDAHASNTGLSAVNQSAKMMPMIPIFETTLGRAYQGDCLEFLQSVESEVVDLAFADPPFNLGKKYSSGFHDKHEEEDYISWCKAWIDEMIRTLKPGGSLFLWNLPKWNLPLGAYVGEKLTFRHWISVDIKYSLPIRGRLYPSHYSLLYFVKGTKPTTFHPDRIPTPCCRHCGGELRDYGGYKDKMNPNGVNLSDVWTDIPPVRHAKYKKRDANALSLKLMDRIICMASDAGDLILDPFGGSGTTFVAAELNGRRWIGSELDCSTIVERFSDLKGDKEHLIDIHSSKNTLFTKTDLERRRKNGKPLPKAYRLKEDIASCDCSPKNEEQMKISF
ncbi:site-specific DNA-methyltransferase [Gluconacetobacter liquefaciens]|uniref:Methyltransferase n=1 Tax=Gluconacetobacter liquefaciens TaxID=89584 RepID=A0A370FT14_GLULI|nr:site-specific DNA-methyltransferase [Gluconacetobacter liquefaciens]RDI32738.1 site-specific DNA-methyltransferase (adenine-specific) [Gluconacetobacter liquefaciens]